jgi:uncharacterized repeat protein (TIGR03806 family)
MAVLGLAASLLAGAPASAGRPRASAPARVGLDARPANATCLAPASGPDVAVSLVPALGGASLAWPTAARPSPADPDLWLVTEIAGRLRRVDAATGGVATALDLTARVVAVNEGGLLGLALHPGFAENGHVYVYYTVAGSPLRSIVSRFTSSNGGQSFDPASERVILDVPQTATNHLGGDLHFGPDGLLYVGLGDGANDPTSAQDPGSLHGKLLRLDVDGGSPYAIPAGNPFAAGGGRPEIFALGFRNPYRWSFDALTGELWLGDVGQNDYEEVDLVVRGGNYGWPDREGFHCLTGGCDDPDYLDPELEYSHAEGCAIIGGFVYRGAALPGLSGAYLYGDYCSARIWSALPNGSGGYDVEPLATAGSTFTAFAQARDGELLVLQTGGAMRLAPAAGSPPDPMPLHLVDSGCVDPSDPTKPAPGLIPFEVNAPLWSDGAAKTRWLALPDGARIGVGADGDFALPPGSVTVKSFALGGKLVETRLFVRHGDGTFGGYSYEWSDDQTDALLLPGAKQRQVGGQTWSYPSRAQCLQCHTAAAGFSLGLELGQLNRDAFYPSTSRTANQLATLAHVGLLDAPLPQPGALPRIERDTTDHAVRGWLHANCSGCHRPGGPTGAALDLRYATSLAGMGACEAEPMLGDLGVAGAKLLLPGDPARSVLSLRARLVGPGQMPPLARALVDANGTAALDAWIRSFPSCAGPDGDGDGRVDALDNCPLAANAGQADGDGDGIGDACETACRNGLDDDGDGAADYPLDPGCASASAPKEDPACDDRADNDGDGRVDGPLDIGCAGASAAREDPPCADRLDNDGDGRVDFDGGRWFGAASPTAGDPQCAGRPTAASEAPARRCGLGFELAPALVLLGAARRRRKARS